MKYLACTCLSFVLILVPGCLDKPSSIAVDEPYAFVDSRLRNAGGKEEGSEVSLGNSIYKWSLGASTITLTVKTNSGKVTKIEVTDQDGNTTEHQELVLQGL